MVCFFNDELGKNTANKVVHQVNVGGGVCMPACGFYVPLYHINISVHLRYTIIYDRLCQLWTAMRRMNPPIGQVKVSPSEIRLRHVS